MMLTPSYKTVITRSKNQTGGTQGAGTAADLSRLRLSAGRWDRGDGGLANDTSNHQHHQKVDRYTKNDKHDLYI